MLPVELQAVIPIVSMIGVFVWWKDQKRKGNAKASGSGLIWWVLPLFLSAAAGSARLSWDRAQSAEYEKTAALTAGTEVRAAGILKDIRPGNGTTYEAVLEVAETELYEEVQAPPEGTGGETRQGTPVSDGGENKSPGGAGREEKAARRLDYGGTILVYLDEAPEEGTLRIGMRVSARGKLERMSQARNPGEFDYKSYYHSLGVEGRMFGEELRIEDAACSPYLDGIFRLKRRAERILSEICGPDDQGVFQAVVLGDKTGLPERVRELYQKNGISHLLAVSGLHVSLIGLGFYRLLRKGGLGFGWSGALAAALTVSYGILTGGSASVVRAVVMICFHLLADKLGRTYDLLSALAAAAVLLLWQSPTLLWQAGFQLSFGAVLAIGMACPVIEKWIAPSGGFGQTLATGLMIQAVTFPVIVYHYFEYPVYGTILNLVVIPLMGYVLLSGLTGIFCGAVWLPLGRFAVGTGHYILVLYEKLCRVFEQMPGAVQIVGRPKYRQLLAYAALWCVFLAWAKRSAAGKEAEKERGGSGKESGPEARGGELGRAVRQAAAHFAGESDRRPAAVPGNRQSAAFRRAGSAPQPGPVPPADGSMRNWESEDQRRTAAAGTGGWSGLFACMRWLVLSVMLLTGFLLLKPLPVSGLRATFLDVGQGDGICLESGNLTILVDGGSTDRKELGSQVLEPFLKYSGIQEVDYAVISHGDEDHISGIREILENGEFPVRELVLPVLGQGDDKYEELVRLAEGAGTRVRWMEAGDEITAEGIMTEAAGSAKNGRSDRDGPETGKDGTESPEKGRMENAGESGDETENAPLRLRPAAGFRLRCLYAGDARYRQETNDHSLLLEVTCGNAGILLTGDIGEDGEKRWLGEAQSAGALSGPIQVLKAAHHGSNYSSCPEFLDYVKPRWAVISCGEGNRYGHPGGETMKRLEERNVACFLTMERGAVILATDGERIRAETMLPP